MEKKIKFKSYIFGFNDSNINLNDRDFNSLIYTIENMGEKNSGVLSGRASVSRSLLDSAGPVILKSYKRGGLVRHFNKETYLKTGPSRCQMEFETLIKAKEAGINVCEPVAFIEKGSFLSKYWLATKEIEGQKSLSDLAVEDEKRVLDLMDYVVSEVIKLAENSFYHVDLHPGNVLVDPDDNIFIIDFDKAELNSLNMEDILQRYMVRWSRAVKKYSLPNMLIDKFRI